jgi:hypothetical protein
VGVTGAKLTLYTFSVGAMLGATLGNEGVGVGARVTTIGDTVGERVCSVGARVGAAVGTIAIKVGVAVSDVSAKVGALVGEEVGGASGFGWSQLWSLPSSSLKGHVVQLHVLSHFRDEGPSLVPFAHLPPLLQNPQL